MTLKSAKIPIQPSMDTQGPHIVIVGGGFGGLYTALYLQKYRDLKGGSITLVEPRERFVFTPLLYEVLTQEMLLWEVAPSYSSLLAGTTIQWQQQQAEQIDLEQQRVYLGQGDSVDYDYLVVATGARMKSLPIPGLREHALPFRSLDDLLEVKARLDQLSHTPPPISVTVIGAGASGVELATKVADRLGGLAKVRLVDRGAQVLKTLPKKLRRRAMAALMSRGVELHLKTTVDEVGENFICLNGTQFLNQLTLWSTGTEPMPWPGSTPISTPMTNETGQVLVRPTLQLESHGHVFVIGDMATHGCPTPNTAQAAYQAAAVVAANVANLMRGRRPKRFRYLHLGDMLTLGKGEGGVWSFGLSLGGKLGGLVRRIVYLYRLPTHHHRFKVARRAIKQLFQKA